MDDCPTPKRLLDKGLSLSLLVVLSPVFALVAAVMGADMVVRAGDRGPWLYRERRISRGRGFDLLEFRRVRRDIIRCRPARKRTRALEADPANLTWAGRRVLKPWYLDELPQLWNVLRGDMSLVGPRPWPPSMVRGSATSASKKRNGLIAPVADAYLVDPSREVLLVDRVSIDLQGR